METQENIEQWGLSLEAILGLEERLIEYYKKYRVCTTTQTDDTSEYGNHYLSSLMRMETKRTMANIASCFYGKKMVNGELRMVNEYARVVHLDSPFIIHHLTFWLDSEAALSRLGQIIVQNPELFGEPR